jgi:dimethylamine/trimethylamine dehydrogenase
MECAIVLGKRGFRRVHLVEAERDIGGVMRWVPRLPGRGEWARVLNWRRIQLEKLRNVEVITGVRLAADDVRDYGAELVVVATGARWSDSGIVGVRHDPVPGADASLPHVLTPEQVMLEGKRPPGRRVVVYDGEGYFMAPGLAELLALEGHDVELVTPLHEVSPFSYETLEQAFLRRRLHEVGIATREETVVTAIEPGRILGEHELAGAVELGTDAIVLVTQRLSNDGVYLELKAEPDALAEAGVEGLYRVGDCVAPQLIADAIFDGHRLAREIDSDDPARPLPWLRERPLEGAVAVDA